MQRLNMKTTNIILIIASFCAGLLFFAYHNQWIIIQLPKFTTKTDVDSSLINKKKISLHFFHKDKWRVETQEQLWTNNISKNLSQLINSWLTLVDEERIVTKKIALESALVSSSGTVYISCDHALFSKEDSIYKKWMLVEGLLKTIRSNEIPIQDVQLLVHHQPLQDSHLDFSLPWPITGFMK